MAQQAPHWAESLEVGDKCLATIRDKKDGKNNLHNVEVVVVKNNYAESEIVGWFPELKVKIPYNDLTKIT